MACKPVVQAVTIAMFGPLKPYLIDTWPEIMLMIDAGTKNGETRRGPRLVSSACVASIMGSPPMPEPMLQPMRTASSWDSASPVGKPLSCTACIAAASPRWMKRSMWRASFSGMYWVMSKPFTSPANLQAKRAHVELGDGVDARLSGQQIGPGLGNGVSDRGNATESGHDDAAFGHAGKPFWKH